jgi:hypothetical protein
VRPRSGQGRHEGERGSAVLEFIVIGVGVMVPMVYVAQCVMTVQAAVFASTQAVREAGRAFSSASTPDEGRARGRAAARLAFADQGLDLPSGSLRITCSADPCLTPGSAVDVQLAWSVPLPWVPASLGDRLPASVPISATARLPVDDFRSSPGGPA